MVVLHTALLAGCLCRGVRHRPFMPALGWPMLAVVRRGAGAALVVHHHAGPPVEHPRRRHPRCRPGHRRAVPVLLAPQLRRRRRRGHRAAVGAHRVDHRRGVHRAQRRAAADPHRGRELRAGEAAVIDLVVAGGGPAGLATAIHRRPRRARGRRRRTTRTGPVDKACGEGLMPHAVAAAAAASASSRRARRSTASPTSTVRPSRDRAVSAPAPGAACAERRCTQALLEAATAAGVPLVHGDVGAVSQDATVGALQRFSRPLPGGRRRPALADPRGPRPGARIDRDARRWGIRRHIMVAPWSDCVEVYWSDGAEAYVTPVADDCVGIAILTSRRVGFDEHLDAFPALRRAGRRSGSRARPRGGPTAAEGPQPDGRAGAAGRRRGGICRRAHRRRPRDRVRRGRAAREMRDGGPAAATMTAAGAGCRRRYRLLTAAVLQATATPAVRSRIVPAAAQFPGVFRGVVNLLAE